MAKYDSRSKLPAHTPGTPRGEELIRKSAASRAARTRTCGRTARDSTSINPEARDPIDPRMPDLPPA